VTNVSQLLQLQVKLFCNLASISDLFQGGDYQNLIFIHSNIPSEKYIAWLQFDESKLILNRNLNLTRSDEKLLLC